MNITNNYDLHQLITEPTSITENSSTLIDLLLTNNPLNILYSAVCEPFLDVNIRYHRPIIALLNVTKPKSPLIHRKYGCTTGGTSTASEIKLKTHNGITYLTPIILWKK